MRRVRPAGLVRLAIVMSAISVCSAFAEQRVIAVLPFHCGEGVPASEGELLYNLFSSELVRQAGDSFTLVVADTAQRSSLLKEIEYQSSGFVKDEDVVRIGNQLGAKEVVFGQIVQGINPKKAQITINFSSVEKGTIVGMYSRLADRTDQGLGEAVSILVGSIAGRAGAGQDQAESPVVFELHNEKLPDLSIQDTQRIDADALTSLLNAAKMDSDAGKYDEAIKILDQASGTLTKYLSENFFKADWPVCEQLKSTVAAARSVVLENYQQIDVSAAVKMIQEKYNTYFDLMRRDPRSDGAAAKQLRADVLQRISRLANADWAFSSTYVRNAYANIFAKDIGEERKLDWRAWMGFQGEISVFAGSGVNEYVDGTGTNAGFKGFINGFASDGTNLYVLDGDRIRKIVVATGAVTTLAGSEGGFKDGMGTAALFHGLRGITTDGENLYVIDDCRIRRIAIATGAVTTLAGSEKGFKNGRGSNAKFLDPGPVATDGTFVYVCDSDAGNDIYNQIRKIKIATGEVSTLAHSWETHNKIMEPYLSPHHKPSMILAGNDLLISDWFDNNWQMISLKDGSAHPCRPSTTSSSPEPGVEILLKNPDIASFVVSSSSLVEALFYDTYNGAELITMNSSLEVLELTPLKSVVEGYNPGYFQAGNIRVGDKIFLGTFNLPVVLQIQ